MNNVDLAVFQRQSDGDGNDNLIFWPFLCGTILTSILIYGEHILCILSPLNRFVDGNLHR